MDYESTAVRPSWSQLPEPVRREITRRLAGPVVDAVSQGAGFTPGKPTLPTSPFLRRNQAAYAAATLGWLRARLGWDRHARL